MDKKIWRNISRKHMIVLGDVGCEWWEEVIKKDAKVFIVKKTEVSSVKTENSEGACPMPRVTHSHWDLELIPISLEVRVRWFHLGPRPRKFIPGSPRKISLQHCFSLTTWLCNLDVTGESQVRLQSTCLPCKEAQTPETWKKFWWAYEAKLMKS